MRRRWRRALARLRGLLGLDAPPTEAAERAARAKRTAPRSEFPDRSEDDTTDPQRGRRSNGRPE